MRPNTPENVWAGVDVRGEDECWEWQRCRDKDGYGFVKYRQKMVKPHRLIWTFLNGSIPNNLLVLHTCDNPPCCNPRHLLLGTHMDNSNDKMAKGRDRYAPARGERNGKTTLTPRKVRTMRRAHEAGLFSIREISDIYGLSYDGAWKIVRGERWQELSNDEL